MSNPDRSLHQLLSRVPLFRGAPERALEIAAAAVRKRVYEANTTVFQEGDKGEALYILEAGLVKLSKIDLGGHEKTLAILQPPAYFGEMALLGEASRSATAITLGEVSAYLLFNDDFRKLIADYPTISLNLNATLCEQVLNQRLHLHAAVVGTNNHLHCSSLSVFRFNCFVSSKIVSSTSAIARSIRSRVKRYTSSDIPIGSGISSIRRSV